MSETDQKASDALTIARWCWPEHTWIGDIDPVYAEARDADPVSLKDGTVVMATKLFGARDYGSVSSAEFVLIERGHAEAYGRALAGELHIDGYDDLWKFCATAATAPLDARVRALAAVIRAQSGQ